MLQPGDAAFDFRLPYVLKGDKKEMTLSSYTKDSNCLIIFYPQNYDIATVSEFTDLQHLIPDFDKASCKIIAISTDDVKSHMDWQKSPGFPLSEVPLLSDADGTVARLYRLFNEEACKIVVDRDRRVVSLDKSDLNVGGNFEEQLRHVQASNATQCTRIDFFGKKPSYLPEAKNEEV